MTETKTIEQQMTWLVEEYLRRDLVPSEVEPRVRSLHVNGHTGKSLQLLLDSRKRKHSVSPSSGIDQSE